MHKKTTDLEVIFLAKSGVFEVKAGKGDPDFVAGVSGEDPGTERVIGVVIRVQRGPELSLCASKVASTTWHAETCTKP